jgi:hypothetical protein
LSGEPERGRRVLINLRSSKVSRETSTRERLGGPVIVAASLLAALAVVLAVVYAFAPRPSGASPSRGAASMLSPTAARYLAVATAANHRLEIANDAYKKDELGNLAAARADLRSEVATETSFDEQLARIPLPLSIASIARALILANEQRGTLTARQARSASLAQLRSFDARHMAKDAAVEVQVRLLRKALQLPPPTTS